MRPHGVYRFRHWIPGALQKLYGKREVRCSLKTSDRSEAIEKARPLYDAVRQKIAKLTEAVNLSGDHQLSAGVN